MNVLIITEGGRRYGFGHVSRCKSIAEAFIDAGVTLKMVINGDQSIEKYVKQIEAQIFDWTKKTKDLLELVKQNHIVLIDSLNINENLYREISILAKKLVVIDDIGLRRYNHNELVLNWLVLSERSSTNNAGEGKFLYGSKYVPLAKEYLDIPLKKISNKIKIVAITMGGSDCRNVTPRILKFLQKKFTEFEFNVLIAEGFTNVKEIELVSSKKTKLHFNPSTQEIINIMMDSDICVATGGHTIYELARIGIPTIHLLVVDNQRKAKIWSETGFTKFVGWWNDQSLLEKISNSIKEIEPRAIREQMSMNGKKMVDGKGAHNIVEYLLSDEMI